MIRTTSLEEFRETIENGFDVIVNGDYNSFDYLVTDIKRLD